MAGPGFQRLVQDARTRVHQFTVVEFVSRLEAGERYILLDVREDAEWVNGHIPSAHHISRGVLEREIERAIPEKNAPIVLYCGGDDRSALAADNLQKMGYANVASLDGGLPGWTALGLPTVKPETGL